MKRSGTIELYDKWGWMVCSKVFDFPLERRKIIEAWETRYRTAMKDCYYQIIPNYDIELVDKDGTNMKDTHLLQFQKRQPICHPKKISC